MICCHGLQVYRRTSENKINSQQAARAAYSCQGTLYGAFTPRPNHERLLALLDDCTEQEADELIPAIRYLLTLMRHQNNPTFQKNQ